MKLFLLTQTENRGYDTYDSCVVCAENEEDAKTITPNGEGFHYGCSCWARCIDAVKCREIGTANPDEERGVIIASFNAG